MSLLLRNYGETDFITGLRFIAAAMVIAIHTQAFRDFGALGNVITDNGKYGVHIFFVISGFTIARTYRSSGGYGRFVGRRMMRIAPLYYLLILIAFLLMQNGTLPRGGWMDYYGVEPDSYNLLMHLTFLSGFDARIANSLLGVEWSIPVEVFWYLVLPLVLPVTMQAKRRLAIFLGLLVLAGLTRVADHLWLPDHAAHFMPFSYGALFYLGALAETWRNQARDLAPRQRVTLT
ncbi:MAG: acyltransferase, partial [Rhodobacteraceae bacterium]|nr:acyltransferase [Paracoccaceae bacterium]